MSCVGVSTTSPSCGPRTTRSSTCVVGWPSFPLRRCRPTSSSASARGPASSRLSRRFRRAERRPPRPPSRPRPRPPPLRRRPRIRPRASARSGRPRRSRGCSRSRGSPTPPPRCSSWPSASSGGRCSRVRRRRRPIASRPGSIEAHASPPARPRRRMPRTATPLPSRSPGMRESAMRSEVEGGRRRPEAPRERRTALRRSDRGGAPGAAHADRRPLHRRGAAFAPELGGGCRVGDIRSGPGRGRPPGFSRGVGADPGATREGTGARSLAEPARRECRRRRLGPPVARRRRRRPACVRRLARRRPGRGVAARRECAGEPPARRQPRRALDRSGRQEAGRARGTGRSPCRRPRRPMPSIRMGTARGRCPGSFSAPS